MKKTVLAIAAAVMMSATMMAQDDNQQSARRERKPVDQSEMVQKRTDATVKAYGLNQEQAAKLLELNKQYAGKMGPRFGRPGDRPGRGGRRDSVRMERPVKEGQSVDRNHRPEGKRGGFEEMRKTMEAYDAELQKIMTEEQFKAYKADREKQMKNGPRPDGRQGRPHKDDDNK